MPAENSKRQARRKRQTRLTFDSVDPSSSARLAPAKVRYEVPSSGRKNKDTTTSFHSPPSSLIPWIGDDNNYPSGKQFAVVIESPSGQRKVDGALPFLTSADPVTSTPLSGGKKRKKHPVSFSEDSDLDDIALHSTSRQRVLQGNPSPFGVDLPKPEGYLDLSILPAGVPSLKKTSGAMFESKPRLGYDGAASSDGSSPEDDEPKPRKTTRRIPTHVLIHGSDSDDSLLESPPRAQLKGGKVVVSHESPRQTFEVKKIGKPKSARNFIKGGDTELVLSSSSSNKKNKFQTKGSKITPSNSPANAAESRKSKIIELSDNEDEEGIVEVEQNMTSMTPRQTQGSSGRRKRQVLPDSESSDSDFGDKITVTQRSKRTERKSVIDDDDDPFDSPQSPEHRRVRTSKSSSSAAETDDDDEPVLSSPLKRKRTFVNNDDSGDESGSSPRKRPASERRRRAASNDKDEEESARRHGKGKDKGKGKGKDNSQTMESQSKRLTRQQQHRVRKPHRTPKQKQLELMIRRKAGEKIDKVTSSESSEDEPRRGIYDSDSEVVALSEFEDEEDDAVDHVRDSIRPLNRDNYDDDFVVADEEEPLGVPTHSLHEIPLQFTHAAHKPLKFHFKDAVEWLVQKKINPSFPRDDPVYAQAFRKLDDEVHGYASSKFSSSAWTKPFTRALWARPSFYQQELDLNARDQLVEQKCGACNRSGHHPTWMIQFGDRAYFKDTLEEIDKNHSSSDSSSESEDGDKAENSDSTSSSVNSNGQTIPKDSKVWYVGRFCKANAEIAHNLIHWKYALNAWVLDTLREDGHLEPETLAEREPWGEKKRSKHANKIVDGWETAGKINSLYRSFRTNLEVARDKKQNRFKS